MSKVHAAFLLFTLAPLTAQHSPVLALVPQAQDMPAPDWVKPGHRLTWYIGVGQSTGDSFVPVGQGTPGDDKQYTIDGRPGQFVISKGGPEGSGHGYLETTVVGVEGKNVALETRTFFLMGVGTADAPKFGGAQGSVAAAGASDWWIHPQALKALVARGAPEPGMAVGTSHYTFEGRRIPAVHILMKDSAWAYDATTGVLLYQSQSNKISGRAPARLPDGTVLDGSGRSTTFVYFRGARQLDLPWRGAAMPEWLQGQELRYQGEQALKQPGQPSLGLPTSLVLTPIGGGPGWLHSRQTIQTGTFTGYPAADPVTAERVFGPGQITSVWLPPAALQGLRRGQRIDAVDRWTNASVAVTFVGTAEGRKVVGISENSALYRTDSYYDLASGVLVRWVLTEPQVGSMFTELDYRLASPR